MKSFLVCVLLVVAVIIIPIVYGAGGGSGGKASKIQKSYFKELRKRQKSGDFRKMEYVRLKDWDIDWSSQDMQQHAIDESPKRKKSRKIGSKCSFSSDCASGCCLLKRDAKVRRCERKAKIGERCSLAQVKADLYVDACPCVSGTDFCPLSTAICTK